MLNFVFQGIKDKRFNVEGAKDMRHLPKILADKEAKEAFLGGTEHRGEKLIGMEAGLRVLEERYPSTPAFQAIKQTLDQLNRMPHAEYAEIPTYTRKAELMYLLRDRLDSMIKDLGLKRPAEAAR